MKNGRNTAGQFSAGNSGRPKGSRNKATLAIESLLQGQAEALTQTAMVKAMSTELSEVTEYQVVNVRITEEVIFNTGKLSLQTSQSIKYL